MMKKKIIGLILICLTSTLAIKECYGLSISIPSINSGSSGNSESSEPPLSPDLGWGVADGYELKCQVEYSMSVNQGTNVYAYNQDDRDILTRSIKPDEKISAGTAIGVSIHEWITISGSVGEPHVTVEKTETVYEDCIKCVRPAFCSGGSSSSSSGGGGNKPFIPSIMEYIAGFRLPILVVDCPLNCNVKCDYGTVGCGKAQCTEKEKTSTREPTASEINECKAAGERWLRNQIASTNPGASYEVYVNKNSNDINDTTRQKLSVEKKPGASDFCVGSNPRYCDYYHKISNVCMDVKTAQVTYRDSNCNSNSEIKIKDGVNGHWHYFTPLNAKSSDTISILLEPKGNIVRNKTFCETAIEKNSNYASFLADLRKNPLSEIPETAKRQVSNGCYLTSNIKIEIEQKFYNETSDKKINGFNFYYKPININNPFPNGVPPYSLWYEWYDKKQSGQNPSPQIGNSYNEKTYIANNIDASEIRNYNNINQYPDWREMKLNGTSNFISSKGMITYGGNRINPYNLGCGPYNKDWEECKR